MPAPHGAWLCYICCAWVTGRNQTVQGRGSALLLAQLAQPAGRPPQVPLSPSIPMPCKRARGSREDEHVVGSGEETSEASPPRRRRQRRQSVSSPVAGLSTAQETSEKSEDAAGAAAGGTEEAEPTCKPAADGGAESVGAAACRVALPFVRAGRARYQGESPASRDNAFRRRSRRCWRTRY